MAANVTYIPPKAAKPEALRVAAYCRVSSDSSDQLHSYATQIKAYTEHIFLARIQRQHPALACKLIQSHPYLSALQNCLKLLPGNGSRNRYLSRHSIVRPHILCLSQVTAQSGFIIPAQILQIGRGR